MKVDHNITFINEFLVNLPANIRIFHFEKCKNVSLKKKMYLIKNI